MSMLGRWRDGVSGVCEKNDVFRSLLMPYTSHNIEMGVRGGANPLLFVFFSPFYLLHRATQQRCFFSQTPNINPTWCAILYAMGDQGGAKRPGVEASLFRSQQGIDPPPHVILEALRGVEDSIYSSNT